MFKDQSLEGTVVAQRTSGASEVLDLVERCLVQFEAVHMVPFLTGVALDHLVETG